MVRTVFAALVTLTLSACSYSGTEPGGGGAGSSPITTDHPDGTPTPTAPAPDTSSPTPSSPTPSTPNPTPGAELSIHDCAVSSGYSVSQYSQPSADGKDLLVLGVYETRSDHSGGSHPEGAATVHVRRTTSHVLVLSAYEPTLWTIDAASGAKIDTLILNGLSPQRVTGVPINVKVINRSGSGNYLADCAYEWPGDPGGCQTQQLASGLHALVSRDVTAFAGCYRATEFTVGERPTPMPPPTSVQYKATCTPGQGPLTTYVAPTLSAPELHLVGVYETSSDHHTEGAASIYVTRTTPLILALSSYEPVHWTVNAVSDAHIQRIILNGYYNQTITAPQGIPVEVHAGSTSWLGSYAYAWPSSEGGSDTPHLVSALEQLTSRSLSSFAGCYQGTAFTLQ